MPSILLIEDDVRIRELLARSLADNGHHVVSQGTAMAGLQSIVDEAPDLVILDLGLPDLEGGELLMMIRAVSNVPIIVATARDDDREIVRMLDAGADDYLVKPFSVSQVEARVRAILRRSVTAEQDPLISIADLTVDRRGRVATLGGAELELTPKEFDLLTFLMERPGEVVSKQVLLAEVWREPYGGSDRTIDVHLSWLRKKLGESANDPRFIHSVFGVGVKIVEPTP